MNEQLTSTDLFFPNFYSQIGIIPIIKRKTINKHVKISPTTTYTTSNKSGGALKLKFQTFATIKEEIFC